jgi:transposase-like protein
MSFSKQTKLQAVQNLRDGMSYEEAARLYGIKQIDTLKKWENEYEAPTHSGGLLDMIDTLPKVSTAPESEVPSADTSVGLDQVQNGSETSLTNTAFPSDQFGENPSNFKTVGDLAKNDQDLKISSVACHTDQNNLATECRGANNSETASVPLESSQQIDPPSLNDHTPSGTAVDNPPYFETDSVTVTNESATQLVDAGSQTWLFATNHQNMAYMLSAGMLMSPAGFGGKHYADPSSDFPGWIPLFREVIPETAIKSSVSEIKGLRPCVSKIDITRIKGEVLLVTRSGNFRSISLPADIDGDAEALLLQAPLPTTMVEHLSFFSEEDRKEFVRVSKADPTIDLSHISIDVPVPYSQSIESNWPPRDPLHAIPGSPDKSPVRGQAIGGMLTMLYHLANRSDLCCSTYRIVAGEGNELDANAIASDPILREVPNWLENGHVSPEAPISARLFWGSVQALVDARLSPPYLKPIDAVLEYLKKERAEEQDTKTQEHLSSLIKRIDNASGLVKGSVTEQLGSAGSLTKTLMLLCIREHSEELLDFPGLDHLLKDHELALAAILFGIREGGWRKLPAELRCPDDLSDYALYRMCKIEHAESKMDFATLPLRPRPLRELCSGDRRLMPPQKAAGAVALLRKYDWTDCIQTYIKFVSGTSWESKSGPDGLQIVAQGDIQPSYDVDHARLWKRISQWPRSNEIVEVDRELRIIFSRDPG